MQWRDELRFAIRVGTLRADHHDLTRSGIVDGESFVWANVDAGVGSEGVKMAVYEDLPEDCGVGSSLAVLAQADRMSALRVHYVKDFVAVTVANSGLKTRR